MSLPRLLVWVLVSVWLGLAAPASAKNVYVDRESRGGNCATGTGLAVNSPTCTCAQGWALLAPGDTMYMRAGRYRWDAPDYCYFSGANTAPFPGAIPSGKGSYDAATVITNYQNDVVTWVGGGAAFALTSPPESYIILNGIHFENIGDNSFHFVVKEGAPLAHHIKIQNGSMYSPASFSGGSMFIFGGGSQVEFRNMDFYNTGGGRAGQGCTDPYGCYVAYWGGEKSLFDGNRFFDNASYTLHIFGSNHNDISENVVSNNVFWNNGFYDLRSPGYYGNGGGAFVIGSGPKNKAFNNLIFGNYGGIQVGYRCHECEVYNNTIYGNETFGIDIDTSSERVHIANNIVFHNGRDIQDSGPGTIDEGNWTTTSGDPQFVNAVYKPCFGPSCVTFPGATTANAHLESQSPARNASACKHFIYPQAGMPSLGSDLANLGWAQSPGIGRPQPSGGRCEPGAYEYQEGTQPSCPPDCPTDESPTVAAIYVDSNGPGHGTTPSDSHSCRSAETITTPKATLASALACMTVACKHLVLRGGTYTGFVDTGVTPITGGPDWGCPTVIRTHAAEVPVVQLPVTNPGGVLTFRAPATDAYIEVRDLTLDGMSRADGDGILVNGSRHLRFANLTIRNTHYSNVALIDASDISLLTSTLTTALGWANVVLYGTADTVLVRGNTITSTVQGGVHLDPTAVADHVTIANNTISGAGTGIHIGPGTGAVVKNNLIRGQRGEGIHVRTGATGWQVYHNDTVSGTGTGLLCDSGAAGGDFANNITTANTAAQLVNTCSAQDRGNITTGTLAALFTNAGAGDYSLKTSAPASPAINSGVPLVSVTEDILGNVRPSPAGGLPDAGAYEAQSAPATGASTDVHIKVMGMFF